MIWLFPLFVCLMGTAIFALCLDEYKLVNRLPYQPPICQLVPDINFRPVQLPSTYG